MGLVGQVEHLQNQHKEWVRKNFADQLPYQPLLGLAEEVGELAHAHLKNEQSIRGLGDPAVAMAAKADAVGDIFIYLMSYCNANNLDLETCINRVWGEVQRRDWNKHPEDAHERIA